jgi:hypothetical protein
MLLVLIAAAVVATSNAATLTGWVIDNECWDQANHIGLDGADLEKSPQDHTKKCLLFDVCKKSGYFLRDLVNGTFVNHPRFDAGSNAKVITWIESISQSDNIYVSVEAEVKGDTATLASIKAASHEKVPQAAASTAVLSSAAMLAIAAVVAF